MLRILAIGLLGALGTSASASDWILVSRDVSGASHQSDRSSYKVVNGYRAAWTSVARPAGAAAERIVHLVYFDCAARRAAMKSGTSYDSSGNVLKTEMIAEDKLKWRAVAPGTAGEAQLRQACSAAPVVASR